jgi:methylated-DNA-[protein]-cysteine S-methyltransferase
MEFSSSFDTELGRGFVLASASGVSRVLLPGEDTAQFAMLAEMSPSELTERSAYMLECYFKCGSQPFDSIPLNIDVSGHFRKSVLSLVRSIPFGEIRSYAQVAQMAGSPGAARAVGGAMAANPVPVIIPCHRVVAANGSLTGYSAPGGLQLKEYLLRMEHVEFKGERTNMKSTVINR